MEHFYKNIEGWFDYEDVFNLAIRSCPENSSIVELGCWKGKSSCYLLTEALNSGKKLNITFVDNWLGSNEHTDPQSSIFEKELAKNSDHVWNIFLENISKVDYPKEILRCDTFEASKHFRDNSIDFLFIDTAHEYDHVSREINIWYPKVKNGGIIAGHDFVWTEVARAVTEFFNATPHTLNKMGTSWMAYKNL